MLLKFNPENRKSTTCVQAVCGMILSAALLGAGPAEAQQQCESYRVQPGDTLGGIANRAQVRGGFQILFNANTNVLSDPNRLQAGQALQIPCLSHPRQTARCASSPPAAMRPSQMKSWKAAAL
jgi:LysM repeat protein